MDGVAGSLFATHTGLLKIELLNDEGGITRITTPALLVPGMQCQLLSSQDLFGELWEQEGGDGQLIVQRQHCVLKLPDQGAVTIPYDPVTHLPVLQAFLNMNQEAQSLALMGCVTQESNQNLPFLSKVLLQWHFKLGHCGFSLVKWIGRTGIFGPMGVKMGKDEVKIPKCAACQFGKQERNAKGRTTTKKDPGGVLKKDKLEPGDLVFVDQFESHLPG